MKLVICLMVIFHHSQSLIYGPTVQISQGELQGSIEYSILGGTFMAFKGIPYATPPVGNLRFMDPLPPQPWNGTLNATQVGEVCRFLKGDGSEDCLYLNVYTPPDFDPLCSPLKSVMVWILGGSGADGIRRPDYLVAKDVIVVVLNHRVGFLGFLNLGDDDITGNQGLKDQVLALKWVQENIAHFGGNPNSVTIAGGGPGAAYVHYLALSSMADGLYHKVIAHSGTVLNPWASLPYCQNILTEELADALDMPAKDSKALVENLKTMDVEDLSELYIQFAEQMSTKVEDHYPSSPSVDFKSKNPFFPTPINIAVQKGVNVPFLLGSVSVEGMYNLALMDESKWITYNSDLARALTPDILKMLKSKGISVQKIREFYFGDKDISPATREIYARMQSDLQYTYGIHDTVAIQVSKHSPTYMYRFSFDNGDSFVRRVFGVDITGVSHLEDLNYVFYRDLGKSFRNPITLPGSTFGLVVNRVTQMWTDFAKTGNPTPAETALVPVKWEPVQNAVTFDVMDISEDIQMEKMENINNRNLTDIQPENSEC